MDINRNNYELFLIDYIDGNLTVEQLKTVEAFLLLNPDLKNELEGLSNHVLIPENQAYKNKFILRRADFLAVGIENEFNYLCIANLENDINEEEEIKLKSIVNSNKSKAKDYYKFLNTKLLPNKDIAYQQKSKLKRFTLFGYTQKQIISFSSAAAMVLLLVTLFNYNANLPETHQNQPIVQDIVTPAAESVSIHNDEIEKDQSLNSIGQSKVPNEEVISVVIEHKEELATHLITAIEPEHAGQDLNLAYLKPKIAHTIKVENDLHGSAYLMFANLTSKEPLGGVDQKQQGTNRTFGLFELAQIGINGLAKATGINMNLEGEKDETGKIKRIEFASDLLALSLPLKQKD